MGDSPKLPKTPRLARRGKWEMSWRFSHPGFMLIHADPWCMVHGAWNENPYGHILVGGIPTPLKNMI